MLYHLQILPCVKKNNHKLIRVILFGNFESMILSLLEITLSIGKSGKRLKTYQIHQIRSLQKSVKLHRYQMISE